MLRKSGNYCLTITLTNLFHLSNSYTIFLRKNGLVCPQKRLRRVKPIYPIFDPKKCNEVWSADYKGKFLMGNKIYCHPLTIADSKSRYVFTAKGHYKENLKSAKSEINGYTSPHSNSFKLKENSIHSTPGNFLSSKVESVVKIGSNIFKGILLRRIIEGTGKKRILELGTNTGFGSSYIVSIEGVELLTIEGSKELCLISEKNISRISENYEIKNCLFDEAIDQLIKEKRQFDCVFIDGQHEREATIHYTKRLKPLMTDDSIYIYDDIYWSDDMNKAWKELFNGFEFLYGIDLQLVGVFQKRIGSKRTDLFDINDYLPRPRIYRKGW